MFGYSGHQYTPMMDHVTYMVAIDTGNGQQQDVDNNEMPCPTFIVSMMVGGMPD